jgi:hypothetical protein
LGLKATAYVAVTLAGTTHLTGVPLATQNSGADAPLTDTFGICDDRLLANVTTQVPPPVPHVTEHDAGVSEQGSGVSSALAEIPSTASAIGTNKQATTLSRWFIGRPLSRPDHRVRCSTENLSYSWCFFCVLPLTPTPVMTTRGSTVAQVPVESQTTME